MAFKRTPTIIGVASVWLLAGIATVVAPELASARGAVAGIGGAACFAALAKQRMDSPMRVALIGSLAAVEALEREMRNANLERYTLVGWIGAPARGDADARRLGDVGELHAVVERHGIELILLSSGARRMPVFEELDRTCQQDDVHLSELAEFYEEHFGHIPIAEINAAWFQCVLHPRHRDRVGVAKRTLDIFAAAAMAVVFLPILLVLIVVIRLDGGPALYRQRRIGERGRPFTMLKLRSMRSHGDEASPWCSPHDERITAIGRFARRTHLDELPQLINVLRGEMTIVGPRPEQPHYVAQLEQAIPHYRRRHRARPGLTGWAQVNCGYGGSHQGSVWKLSHDLYYLKNASLLLDVRILLRTLAMPFRPPQFDEPAPRPFVFGPATEDPRSETAAALAPASALVSVQANRGAAG